MASSSSEPGSIGWVDLTVTDAVAIRNFYTSVIGWKSTVFDMGTHQDFCVHPEGEEKPVAGICHAVGDNVNIPPVWLVYVNVADLDASLKKVTELGGKIINGPREMSGMGRFAAIQDPAGATLALFEPKT